MLDNIISALSSIWGNKLRSLLTLLGVVIGVASVTTLIALGQGLKNDVAGLIQGFGTNVIVVIAGKIDTKATNQQVNPASLVAGDILTLSDVNAIKSLPEMEAVSPISLVSGTIKASGKESSSVVAGTYPNFLNALQVLKLD
jgi:putative ABC transport system permease protein